MVSRGHVAGSSHPLYLRSNFINSIYILKAIPLHLNITKRCFLPFFNMALDRIDDDSCWDGGKVVPWPQGGYVAQQILPSYVDELEGFDGLNFESPNAKTLNRLNMETLTEFEALMLGELSTDGSSEDEIETVTTSTEDEAPFPFMELPLEIRLQVYRWLHLMTPITLTQFAPWYPNPVYRSYHVKTVTLGDDINTLGVEPGALVASRSRSHYSRHHGRTAVCRRRCSWPAGRSTTKPGKYRFWRTNSCL